MKLTRKIELILLFAAVGFAIGGLITYKLLNRRRTSGSLRELYEDNAEADIYSSGEYGAMCDEFVNSRWLYE